MKNDRYNQLIAPERKKIEREKNAYVKRVFEMPFLLQLLVLISQWNLQMTNAFYYPFFFCFIYNWTFSIGFQTKNIKGNF